MSGLNKVRIAALKREEDQLGRDKEALDIAKLKHQRYVTHRAIYL